MAHKPVKPRKGSPAEELHDTPAMRAMEVRVADGILGRVRSTEDGFTANDAQAAVAVWVGGTWWRCRDAARRLKVGSVSSGGQPAKLWIYGTDHRVHAPGFPLSTKRIVCAALIAALIVAAAIVIAVLGNNT
jgi:hypothetical protein